MLDQHTQNYLETISFFQRLPALEMHGIGGENEPSMPQSVEDLVRDWKRMRHQDLSPALIEVLVRADSNMLFNMVGHCFDILLRRIVPKYDHQRQRAQERKARRRAREDAQLAALLSGAASEAESEPQP